MHDAKASQQTVAGVGDSDQHCAEQLVRSLFARAGMLPLTVDSTLAVSIGDGNWISYMCDCAAETRDASDPAATLDEFAGRANESGEVRLRRSARRGDASWFRTEGAPSLHFQIVRDDEKWRCRGHVDAAHPLTHPVSHLIFDYLPARGIGTHPRASKLLSKMQHIND